MNQDRYQTELRCRHCSHVERAGFSQMLTRLQQVGVLRRCKDPDPQLVWELFVSTAPRFACGRCGQTGLLTGAAADDDWDEPKRCERCDASISRERLEVFPDAKLCATCQKKSEARAAQEVEYCPRCGEIMKLRLVNRGLTRYRLMCPGCGTQR